MKTTKRWMMAAMCVCLSGPVASAGTITKSTEAPTDVFASSDVSATSYTRVFANGARPTDYNEGRGNEIIGDSGSIDGYTMDSLVLRKDGIGGNPAPGTQDFTGTTATLTLYVFEGTKEEWDAGNGQSATDTDLFDGTVITTIYTETFPLNDSYAEGDYLTLTLDTPITMGANMGFFIKMDQGDSAHTFFQIVQKNSDIALSDIDGWQYQAPTAGNLYTGSPLEYYAVGTLPPPAPTVFAITEITYDGGDVTLQVKGAPNTTYDVKASATLADGFPDLLGTVTTDGSGSGSYGPFAGVGSAAFYRLETQP